MGRHSKYPILASRIFGLKAPLQPAYTFLATTKTTTKYLADCALPYPHSFLAIRFCLSVSLGSDCNPPKFALLTSHKGNIQIGSINLLYRKSSAPIPPPPIAPPLWRSSSSRSPPSTRCTSPSGKTQATYRTPFVSLRQGVLPPFSSPCIVF